MFCSRNLFWRDQLLDAPRRTVKMTNERVSALCSDDGFAESGDLVARVGSGKCQGDLVDASRLVVSREREALLGRAADRESDCISII